MVVHYYYDIAEDMAWCFECRVDMLDNIRGSIDGEMIFRGFQGFWVFMTLLHTFGYLLFSSD